MRLLPLMLVVCLLIGCTLQEPPAPPVVPAAPEDLSTWTVPEVVPLRSAPRPQMAKDAPPTPAEKVYPFLVGGTYTVPVGVGQPLDIVFRPGEKIHNMHDGDRPPQEATQQTRRWDVQQGKDGVEPTGRDHLFVTVTEPGLRNGLIITTTHATYYVTLESVTRTPIRVLRWQTLLPEPVHAPGPLPDLDAPMQYHAGYVLEAQRSPAPTWVPRQVVDDGRKIYVLFPEGTLFETVPLIRALGPHGPQVINSRQFLNVVILDQVAAALELRVGTGEHAEVVTIRRGQLTTIDCPGAPDCPRWPEAARVLAGRAS